MTTESLINEYEDFDSRFEIIKSNIAEALKQSGRTGSVTLLAATKTRNPELINYAIKKGIDTIGENRVQEYLDKYDALNLTGVRRHFIGNLQTNKVKYIIDKVDLIESVGSLKLAGMIGEQAERSGKTMDILLEVNVGKEDSKGGFYPEEVMSALLKTAQIKGLRVMGLMTIPPHVSETSENEKYFEMMQKLFVDICGQSIDNVTMKYLSMGMSDDYETAVLYGANLVRIGTALFGSRTYN